MSNLKKENNELLTWAKKEVEFYQKDNDNMFSVPTSNLALDLFENLINNMSFDSDRYHTCDLFIKMVSGYPLTPIVDTPEIWKVTEIEGLYQCKRYKTLFKKDGPIYTDTNRSKCIDINNPDETFVDHFALSILDELYPITFPYDPSVGKIKIYMERFNYHEDNEEWDTIMIAYFQRPDGELAEVKKCFKRMEDGKIVLIKKTEYFTRKEKWLNRKEKEKDGI